MPRCSEDLYSGPLSGKYQTNFFIKPVLYRWDGGLPDSDGDLPPMKLNLATEEADSLPYTHQMPVKGTILAAAGTEHADDPLPPSSKIKTQKL